MKIEENIRLSAYRTEAGKAFDSMLSQLDKLDGQIRSMTSGRTPGGVAGAAVLPVVWIIGYLVLYAVFREQTGWFGLAAAITVVLLSLILIIDNLAAGKHYGSVFAYKAQSERLRQRVEEGKKNVERNAQVFSDARRAGWNMQLSPQDSIPDSMKAITNSLGAIRSLEGGKINLLLNFLYYTAIVAVTAAGSVALYPVAEAVIHKLFSDHSFEAQTIPTLCIIGTVIACVAAALLGSLVWGIDMRVTNKAMLYLPAGPVLFLALMALGAVLVFLVIGLVKIVIAIATVAIGALVVCGCLSGG